MRELELLAGRRDHAVRTASDVDDLAQHARVRVDLGEPRPRTVRRLVGEAARAVDAVRDDVAVAVEDVVDDLEEQAELVAERAPRPLLRLRRPRATQSASADRRREEAARLQPVQRRLVGRGAGDVEVLAADHAERRLRELARDMRRVVRRREPERLGEQRVAGEDPDRLAVVLPRRRLPAALLVVVERRQVVVDERERVHELERAAAGSACLAARRRPPRPSRGRSPAGRACRRP